MTASPSARNTSYSAEGNDASGASPGVRHSGNGTADGRPRISVCPGIRGQLVDQAEAALLRARFPIFQRSGWLVRPCWQEMKTSGRKTVTALSFTRLNVAALRDMLSASLKRTARRVSSNLHEEA